MSCVCAEAHLTCAAAEAPLLLDMDQHFFGPGGWLNPRVGGL
jgi:hypothetical protein